MSQYIENAVEALTKARKFLQGNTRPHVLIGRTPKGYLLIDPRHKGQHYCQIVGKLYRQIT